MLHCLTWHVSAIYVHENINPLKWLMFVTLLFSMVLAHLCLSVDVVNRMTTKTVALTHTQYTYNHIHTE